MKTIRSLFFLAGLATLAANAAFASAEQAPKTDKAACGCVVGADKKVCGVDTDCCCTGAKATSPKKDCQSCGCATAKDDKAACPKPEDCGPNKAACPAGK